MNEISKDMEQTTAQLRVRERELQEERVRNRWISVKDRLPEIKTNTRGERCTLSEYVLTYQVFTSGVTWIGPDKYNIAGNWLSEVPCDDQCKVTHWMPLPELPEEDMA